LTRSNLSRHCSTDSANEAWSASRGWFEQRYTLKGKKFGACGLQAVVINVLTREQTGKFNWEHYTWQRQKAQSGGTLRGAF
jgi:hypothetical protein